MYSAERVIGNGSFGVVYQATINATSETVAIKKVLQDRRYKVSSFLVHQIFWSEKSLTLYGEKVPISFGFFGKPTFWEL